MDSMFFNKYISILLQIIILLKGQYFVVAQGEYYGREIGQFVGGNNGGATQHSVQGTVYAIDNTRLWIIGFSYDGSAPDAFLWAGNTSQPDPKGDIIPIEYGSYSKLGAYSNQDLVIRLPKGKLVTDYKWISVWCRAFGANFAQVLIPDGFTPPSEYLLTTTDGNGNDIPLELGFSRRVHGVHADRVYIMDTRRIRLENLDYDGQAPNSNYWIGLGNTPNSNGWVAWDENWSDQNLPFDATKAFVGKTVIVTIPPPHTVHDIDYLSLWCITFTQDFGHVDIPDLTTANIPPYVEDQGPYYGKELGLFVGGPNDAPTSYDVYGQVYAVDSRTLLIKGFTYNGQAPATYLWVGSTDEPSGEGQIIPVDYRPKLRAYDEEDVYAHLPRGTTMNDFKWISVWCEEAGVSFGHVYIPSDYVAPAEHDLNQKFPSFYPYVHGVSADGVYIVDHKTIRIENLNYDGNAPDTYYWTGPTWEPTADGWIASDSPISDMMLPNDNIGYTDKTVTITMPEGYTVFDVGHIGLWCRLAKQDFGHVKIPPRSQLNVPPSIDKPQYYGAFIGEFTNGAHGVKGKVYAIDNSRLWLVGFSYDGLGPDTYLYAGTSSQPDNSGEIIPIEYPRKDILGAYDNVDAVVQLPKGKHITDYKWISVWCVQAATSFAHVDIPSDFQPPAEHLISGMLGFNPPTHAVRADKVYVIDTRRFRLENLYYDGLGPDAYYWYGPEDVPDRYGLVPLDENWSQQQIPSDGTGFQNKTVVVTMPEPMTVFDVGYLGLWCVAFMSNFGHINIPAAYKLTVPPYVEYEGPYYGADLGAFSGDGDGSPALHGVEGTVFAIDNRRIQIIGFSYDGLGPDAYVYVGSTDMPSGDGIIIPVQGSLEKLGEYQNEDIIVTLPEGTTINDYKWISIWCKQAEANFGHVWIPSGFQPPAEHSLNQQLGNAAYGVTSSGVFIVDDKTVRIENLYYDGNAADASYWFGPGYSPDVNGMMAIDTEYGDASLPSDGVGYSDRTVTLTLPDGYTVFDLGHIGIWCPSCGSKDLGHVKIPPRSQLNVPPYVEYEEPVVEEKYYGNLIGELVGSAHDVAGKVYAIDESRLWLVGFNYDGEGPDTFIWAGSSDMPDDSGEIIPIEYPREEILGAYNNRDIVVRLPWGRVVTDYKWISVWCRDFAVNFGHVLIPANFEAPSEFRIPGELGYDPRRHNVHADAVYIIDTKRFRMENLDYDGFGPDTFYWTGLGEQADQNGWAALDENWSPQKFAGVPFNGKTVIVTLPDEYTVFDVDYIGLWCKAAIQDFGHVLIPDLKAMNVTVPPYVEDQGPYYGADLGPFSGDGAGSPTLHGVAGTVFAIDDTRIQIIGFSYDGLGPDAYVYVGSTDMPSGDGMIAPVAGSSEKLAEYQNEDIIVTLPEGTTINDYKWISIWCKQAVANFGHVMIGDTFQAPAEHNLQQKLGFKPPLHDVTADAVYIVDTRTLRIENLNYDGAAPDTYYWAGKGMPDSNGFIVLDEFMRDQMISTELTDHTVTVTLPEGESVFDIDYLSLWCRQASADFGHVTIPPRSQLNVPPHIPVVVETYYGKEIGVFSLDGSPPVHGVTGTVYAMDSTRLWITGFSYDGLGPDAYLWVGTTDEPGATGYIVPVDGSTDKLAAYENAELVVTLPDGMTIDHYKWISVWCRQATANFGHVLISPDFVAPMVHMIQQTLGQDPPAHGVQADKVEILDTRRLRITNLTYDGQAPDTYFWAGKGTPDANGFIVPPADGSDPMLPDDGTAVSYESVVLLLPEGITVFDIDYIGLWCRQAAANFGHVEIPAKEDISIPPYYFVAGPEDGVFDNCEVLMESKYHVSWTIEGDTIAIEMKGLADPGTYLGFGISGSDSRTSMVGADVAVGWIDQETNAGMIEDYYLSAYGQCIVSSGMGACPDTISTQSGTRSVTMIKSSFEDGITTVSYRRPLNTGETADKMIRTDQAMYIAWGIGPINPVGHAAKHRQRTVGDVSIDFGRPTSTCPVLSTDTGPGPLTPWIPAEIVAGSDITTFHATMGQAGGPRGYEGITGRAGWGIAWYINDEIIPVLTLTRGVTYTFEVLGGDDPNLSAQYHPFYITDDPDGGHFQKSAADQQGITIFAGPTEGPLCSWESQAGCSPNDYNNFGGYRDACLTEECAPGDPGILAWTPDENTPDLVYYQCYTHRFLGWKIHVVDPPSLADTYYGKLLGDLAGPSVNVSTAHGVAGKVYAIDSKTLWVRDFSFDGQAPDTYFWVGTTPEPGSTGEIAPFDINNPDAKLGAYMNEHLIVNLPEGKTLADYTWISVWCRQASANFAQVYIPVDFVTPAEHDLGMLGTDPPAHDVQADRVVILNTRQFRIENLNYDGTAPDTYYWAGTGTPDSNGFIVLDENMMPNMLPNDGTPLTDVTVTVTLPEGQSVFDIDYLSLWCRQAAANFGHVVIPPMDELCVPPYIYIPGPEDGAYSNCEVLVDNMYHVSWTVAGGMIDVELKGVVEPDTYLAFGISGSDSGTSMIGADVAVGWIDPGTSEGMLEDYYLNAYGQCVVTTGSGACPDTITNPSGVSSVTLVKSSFENGITAVSYRRPLDTGDTSADKVIHTDQPMYIAWGIGPINPSGLVAKHRLRTPSGVTLDFGRQSSTCPVLSPGVGPDPDAPWIPAEIIAGKDITTFRATMGQAGGRRGYEGITGRTGWGIAWYLNDEIIPVLTLTRGVTYTFEVLGGNDPDLSAQYHPFYITDDPDGGYFQKSEAEQQGIEIFAGPTEGPLCQWESTPGCSPNDYNTFAGYRDNCLTEQCAPGEPGVLRWTPDENTPDLVYYQCYTHRFLGWKIHIVDPPSLGDTYYGKLIGEFNGGSGDAETAHGVAGKVYAIDDRRLWIRDFSFDGQAPDTYFWLGNSATPDASGEIAAFNPNYPEEKLGAYNNEHLVVTLPTGKTLADYTWISVWCKQAGANFAQVLIANDFVTPAEHDLGMLGTDPPAHDVQADRVVILNTRQFRIENLNYDGTAPDTYYWAGTGTPDGNGFIVLDENMQEKMLPSDGTPLVDVTVTVTLPEGQSVFDIDYLSLWCRQAAANFGHVIIPPMDELCIPPYVEMPKMAYYGKLIGNFVGGSEGTPTAHGVAGRVFAIDDRRLWVRDFSFDGNAPDTYFWLGNSAGPDASGEIAAFNPFYPEEKLGAYNGEHLVVTLPTGKTLADYTWISVWCKQAGANFAQVLIANDFVTPAEHDLGMLGTDPPAHDVQADRVVILNTRQFRIENLNYDGTAPDTYYWAGTGTPDGNGFIVLDENMEEKMLPSDGTPLVDVTVTITLPEGQSVFDIDYLSLWCRQAAANFGHVIIPPMDELCIPPYVEMPKMAYFGKLIGALNSGTEGTPTAHGVAGTVFAIDDRRLWIRDFSFDGEAPDTYFWLGNSAAPDDSGEIAAFNPNNPEEKLGAYNNENLIATLPPNKTLADYTWISVWCKQAGANFAQVLIANDFVTPAEHDLGMLGTDPPAHDVQADRVVILNTRQFRIENLNYDGTAPDTYYWAGTGTPDGNGFIVLDENMEEKMLPSDGTPLVDVTVTVTLPEGQSVFDIDYLSLWCRQAAANFGHVIIPPMDELCIPPYVEMPKMDKQHDNCEVLIEDQYHASWTIEGDMIEVSLSAKVEPGTYMAFGRSGSDTRTFMIDSDVIVAWIDEPSNTGRVVDYALSAYGQCSRGSGACPDEMSSTRGTNNVELVDASFRNGVSTVTYRRPLDTGDGIDRPIPTDQPIYVSWGIGPINPSGLVVKHSLRTPGDLQIDFGRQGSTCPDLQPGGPPDGNVVPWQQAEIGGEGITHFRADIGQSGGKKGYEGIVGRAGWGIAWYINEELIPIITVKRGETYTFDVYGGDDPNMSASYHPFYITDDPDGGYVQLSEAEQQNKIIYAGPEDGSLCEWVSNGNDKRPEEYDTFAEYRDQGLVRNCRGSTNGVLTWTPDANTPDEVYYQCYTHKYLGWKIRVVDEFPVGDYFGNLIGEFNGGSEGAPTAHDVAGKVYAIDDRRLWIRDFSFDGNAPDTYFWLGNSAGPDASGEIAAFNPADPEEKLGAYNNEHLVAILPPGKTLTDYTWISVWCREAGVNFGQVLISSDFVTPAVHDLGMLGTDPPAHDVQADRVVILNTRQFRIENLNYDGTAPDTYYWAGKGIPDSNGFIVLDENMEPNMLPSDGTPLTDVTVTVTLPQDKTVFDIDYLGLWCRQANADFGHVVIPPPGELNVPPYVEERRMVPDKQYDNCEVLIPDEFHASWTIEGDMIEMSLSGKVQQGTYMAFGRSGSDTKTLMLDSDVTVAWIDDRSNSGRAVDYKLSQYGQCSRGSGACPDEMNAGGGVNNVELLGASFRDGVSTVSFRRPLDTGDQADLLIPIDGPVYISWGIGPINPSGLVVKHSQRTIGDLQIDFGRQSSTCPSLLPGGPTDNETRPWQQAEIGGEGVKFFRADIGQSGGKKGYEGIVGRPGWGIAWYINWELIPIITVKRGETYTFDVFGGDDSGISASYHPFYITNDPDGGYVQLSEEEKRDKIIYAGPVEGALCEWASNGISKSPEEYETFAEYRDKGLVRRCEDHNRNGVLTWTPDADTPDEVYYQCYTHKYLGWKIRVVDEFPPKPATDPPGGGCTRTVVSIATIILSLLASLAIFRK